MRGPAPAHATRHRASPALTSFNAGELSPALEGRIDLEKYTNGCRSLQNYLPRVQGAALKRSGFRFVAPVKGIAGGGTATIVSGWSADVTDFGLITPDDGNDGLFLGTDGQINRNVSKFSILEIPTNATITAVSYRLEVRTATNMSGKNVTHGGYAGDGISEDPQIDSAADVYARCNVSTYGTAFNQYQTTGLKTVSLGANAVADLQSALALGAEFFSVGSKFTSEVTPGSNIICSWDEYVQVSPPALIVTYTVPTSAARLIPFEFSTEQAYVLEFGDHYMRVYKDEGPVLESARAITGTTNATPVVVTSNGHGYTDGQEVFVAGTGIAALDGRTWIVAGAAANTFQLQGSTAPGATSSTGTVARVYEIATPYLADDVESLAWAQSADVMYLVHRHYAPRKLSRTGHDSWTLVEIPFDWFPFAPENTDLDDYVGASSATGSVLLISSGGHFNAGHVGSYLRLREVIESQHAEWKPNEDYSSTASPDGGYGFFRSAGTMQVGDQLQVEGRVYEITDKHGSSEKNGSTKPVHEDGQATDGRWDLRFVSYGAGYVRITTVLDAFRAQGDVVKELPKSCVSPGQNITAYNSANPIQLTIAGHGYETGDKIFISGALGTRGAAINNQTWTVTRVGTDTFTIPVNGSGLTGSGGVARQMFWASNLNGSAPSTYAIRNLTKWSFGAWSSARGYPRAVSFFEDRLWLAGTASDPQTLWASRTSHYEDFRETDEDDSSLLLTLNTNTVNVIAWLIGQDQLLIGTASGTFTVRGGNDEPVTPANVRASRKSTDGAQAGILPIAEGPATIFAQRAGRKVLELVSDLDTSSLLGVDLTILADHITLGTVRQMAFQREPDRVLWVVLEDGQLLGFTYERQQQVTAWHRHPLGGTSAAVESVAVIPAPAGDRDQLWVIARVTVNGTVRRFVEVLEASWARTQSLAEAFFVDHGLSYQGAPATTIGGLHHLVGESVFALADGFAAGPFTVSATGTITLAAAASTVHVGHVFQAVLETMRLEAGGADGTAQGKRKRVTGVVLRLDQTGQGLAIGSTIAESTQDLGLSPGVLTDGDTERLPWPGRWEQAGRLVVRHALPTPCTITGIFPVVETTD